MFFKREDILKIHNALLQLGVKDSELPNAEPVTYNDVLSIVQEGKNKQIGIKDFFNQISLWKKEDFINITDEYDKYNISLLEAINLVPTLQRKNGLVITFQDIEGNWEIYQFRGNITEFFEEDKWFNLYDYRNYIIQSIVPDEEDLTASTPDENGNSLVYLKDRIYNPAIFSGKGYKFVRKNIINIELATIKISVTNPTTLEGDIYFNINNKGIKVHLSPTIHNTTKLVAEAIRDVLVITYNDYKITVANSVVTLIRKYSGNVSPTTFEMYNTGVKVIVEDTTIIEERNIITQEDINEKDTIYEIRYDFDLDGKTITIPNNCVLYFTSGKFYNGSINMDNTIVSTLYEDVLSEVNINGNYYNIQEYIKNHQKQLDDKQSQIDDKQQQITANDEDISLLQTRSTQMEETIKGIAATGGASQATAVTYNNEKSKLTAVNIQSAVDEVVDKASIKNEEGTVVETPFRYIQNEEFIFAKVDAEDKLLFGIQWDGTPVFGKISAVEDRLQTQVTLLAERVATIMGDDDITSTIDTLNELKTFFTNIENTQSLTDILANLDNVDKNLDKTVIKDEEGNIQDTPFRVIESPEFLKAITDSEDRFLCGIKPDGSVEWVKGIPSPIRAKLQEIVIQIQLQITNLQETKVDKEEGKSLIEDEVKECFRVISNDEFLWAVVDSEDRVLFGLYRDSGKPYFPLNEMYHVIQNEEYFAAWLDADDKVVLGIRRDGQIIGEIYAVNSLKKVISQIQADLASLQEKVGTIDTNLKELLDIFSLQENSEYMAVEKDADGKVLSATYNDGSHYIHNAKSETIPEEFEHIEDPEGRTEITTDADKKVMSYRDSSGKKHEHDMEITNLDVSNLNLQGNSVNNIQDALKANGFDVKTPIDWSESSFIQIPEPRFAIINVSNIDSMPTTKTQNKKAFLEFWDMQGNYFKKHAILNAQGNSSLGFVKKNVAIDLCDDEWIGDDTPKVRIGNWVPQDSFHMKAYYTDFFRGVGAVSYKLYDQIVRTRGNMYDRPWKKALLDMSKIGTSTKSLGNPYVGDYGLLTDTGARCFPDGFPVAVYLNGEFYGIFSFQLKKHRDNYHMDKSMAEHVHLDGVLSINTIFGGKEKIDWSQFEIRNPKGLYAIGGNKYDADVKQEEIAGETEINAWIAAGQLPNGKTIDSKIKKALQMTAKVKKYIQNFADAIPAIKTAMNTYESSDKSNENFGTFKKVYEKYFDVENMIDYLILSDLIKNSDGFSKNWQWFTYDGTKWWVGLYDCDMSFGGHSRGNQNTGLYKSHLDVSLDKPNGYITKYYVPELEARYKELADISIASSDNIFSLLQDWCMRIGTDFFKEEYKKWADSPCISDSIIRSDYWELVKDEHGVPQTDTTETYDATTAYEVGEVVSFGLNKLMGFFKYKCIKATTALAVNTPHEISTYCPIKEFRHCDNIYRAQKWIEQNVNNMDKLYNYTRN